MTRAQADPAAAAATALPPRHYLDAAAFERERDRVFFAGWQFACHTAQVADPGDYAAFYVLDQGVFVIRGLDGVLRAFYNVCQHRAHELVEGEGNAKALICPYHAWTYAPDGRLRKARNADKVPGFDPAEICLTPVRLEEFCGFVFVNLDGAAPPMAALYPGVEDELRALVPDLEGLAPARRIVADEAANWKIAVENYNECYHCAGAHPTFATGVVAAKSYRVAARDRCLRHSAVAADGAPSYDRTAGAGAAGGDYRAWFLWPAFAFQVYPGGVLNTYCWRPEGPARTRVLRDWYAPGGKASPALEALAEQDRATTFAEDLAIVAAVQRGLASRGYRPGPLVVDPAGGVDSEHPLAALHAWLGEALAD